MLEIYAKIKSLGDQIDCRSLKFASLPNNMWRKMHMKKIAACTMCSGNGNDVQLHISGIYYKEQLLNGNDICSTVSAHLAKCLCVSVIKRISENILAVESDIPRVELLDIIEEVIVYEGIPMSYCSLLDNGLERNRSGKSDTFECRGDRRRVSGGMNLRQDSCRYCNEHF